MEEQSRRETLVVRRTEAGQVQDDEQQRETDRDGASQVNPGRCTTSVQDAGAPEPTQKELNALAAKARTPAEHRGLEEYFLTLAKRYTAEANEHVALAQAYRARGSRKPLCITTPS
jgi:hypothetical protein